MRKAERHRETAYCPFTHLSLHATALFHIHTDNLEHIYDTHSDAGAQLFSIQGGVLVTGSQEQLPGDDYTDL
jgi:hypothetical protein